MPNNSQPAKQPRFDKKTTYHAWYWVAALIAILIIQAIFASYTQIAQIPYSQFQDDLKAGKIAEVRVSGNYIQGKLKAPDAQGRTEFITTRVDPEIAQELGKYDVKFAGAIESTFLRDLLSWVIPIGLFFGIWYFMYRRFANQAGFGGVMSVGRSKAKIYVETDTKTTFDDVAGVDEAKAELQEVVAFLKDPERYGRLGGRGPKGGVLGGPPPTRPEVLAPARLRAGRFDRQVLVDRPDKEGRVQILMVHVRKIRLAPDVDLETVASLTPGFTRADLANLVHEAPLSAPRRGADAVTLTDFTAAMERIVAGLEKRNRLLNPHEREVVAYHEMGHTLVALSLPGSDKVHKVSIIPRGIGSLGYTIQRPTEDRFLMTREELDNKMPVLLGGRAAEHIVFGELSTGAADDLVKVSDIARSIVTRYGMTPELGQVVYEKNSQNFLAGPSISSSANCRLAPPTTWSR